MINSAIYYGDVGVGPNFRFVATDLNDQKSVSVGSQQYQQSYMNLLMPYAYVGVGRSNNYVETFTTALAVDVSLSS